MGRDRREAACHSMRAADGIQGVTMQYTRLSNGVEMPMLGYGVFQIDNDTTARCVKEAIESGYRLIDTAQAYGNEAGVAAGIAASGIDRKDLFVVSKVWVSQYGEGTTYDSIKASVATLGGAPIDLMLLHQAYADYYAAWRDMERAYEDGLVRAIGVSNFNSNRLIDLCTFAKVAPLVNQVETHVFWAERPEHAVMEQLGVQHMAWGPFAEGANDFFRNPLLKEIGEKYGKSVGQVALRYLMDLDVVVIPKSTRRERMEENIDVFDFELSDEDRARIATLDGGTSICYDHNDPTVVSQLTGFIKQQMGR